MAGHREPVSGKEGQEGGACRLAALYWHKNAHSSILHTDFLSQSFSNIIIQIRVLYVYSTYLYSFSEWIFARLRAAVTKKEILQFED